MFPKIQSGTAPVGSLQAPRVELPPRRLIGARGTFSSVVKANREPGSLVSSPKAKHFTAPLTTPARPFVNKGSVNTGKSASTVLPNLSRKKSSKAQFSNSTPLPGPSEQKEDRRKRHKRNKGEGPPPTNKHSKPLVKLRTTHISYIFFFTFFLLHLGSPS